MRSKPTPAFWIDGVGWQAYLSGALPEARHLLQADRLWALETRIGVGLDPRSGRAADGALFSTQAVSFCSGVGFMACIDGAEMPERAMLRLGGDGRAAVATHCMAPIASDADSGILETIVRQRRARIVLRTPALFPDGWRLPGMQADGSFSLGAVTGRVRCAAVPRGQTISGWDLALGRPKPAERVVPVGSVYWLDELTATADQLHKLASRGLWADPAHDAQRRAEGFNRFNWAVDSTA